uniref:Actin-related protein 2/3 complex subunit 4 n=1 Tax=Bigelowiella natans TaxID=227086 RepID=Q5YET0_BIGNA|nr:actin related protein [Bigelowiella natans]|mmetsp:Transcript_1615/g.2004  ORF Transcript_1615/g.2004 Transcript_1615/m.2004 type:complete len:177 (+) Transcript_1615:72-602(+)|eukprot:jgi/Bigna1/92458/estExt_fgenesh1_pm.C_250003
MLGAAKERKITPYLKAVKATLSAAICVRNFPSQVVERHNKPAVETQWAKELLLAPVVVAKSDKEAVKIEGSINALRISIKIKQMDTMEGILVKRFSSFLEMRADDFVILRRKAMPGYDVSFLITHFHTEKMWRDKLVDFIVTFIQEINSEISDLRLKVNSRGRNVAEHFFNQFTKK